MAEFIVMPKLGFDMREGVLVRMDFMMLPVVAAVVATTAVAVAVAAWMVVESEAVAVAVVPLTMEG